MNPQPAKCVASVGSEALSEVHSTRRLVLTRASTDDQRPSVINSSLFRFLPLHPDLHEMSSRNTQPAAQLSDAALNFKYGPGFKLLTKLGYVSGRGLGGTGREGLATPLVVERSEAGLQTLGVCTTDEKAELLPVSVRAPISRRPTPPRPQQAPPSPPPLFAYGGGPPVIVQQPVVRVAPAPAMYMQPVRIVISLPLPLLSWCSLLVLLLREFMILFEGDFFHICLVNPTTDSISTV